MCTLYTYTRSTVQAHPQQIMWFVVDVVSAWNCQLNHNHHINHDNDNDNDHNNNNSELSNDHIDYGNDDHRDRW